MRQIPIHAFLIPIYFVIANFSVNAPRLGAHPLEYLPSPLVASITTTALLIGCFWVGMRDTRRAGLMAAVVWVFLIWGPPGFFLMLALVLSLGLAQVLSRKALYLERITWILNMGSAALTAAAVIMCVVGWPSSAVGHRQPAIAAAEAQPASRPHIFYIVLDGYGRADILRDIYGHDDTPFLERLTGMGFAIPKRSRTNYGLTPAVLASSLNMRYLDNLAALHPPMTENRRPLIRLITESRVVDFLTRQGYETTTFSSGSVVTDFFPADTTIAPVLDLSELDNSLLSSTPIADLMTLSRRLTLGDNVPDQVTIHRRRIQNIMQRLAEPASEKTPQFVLVHIMVPHPPFVFDPDGSRPMHANHRLSFWDGADILPDEDYRERYRAQVAFLNEALPAALERVFAAAAEPPVIIIHGDHGPGSELHWSDPDFEAGLSNTNVLERFSNLTAIHLPNASTLNVPDDLTPVNIFPLTFNHVFGTSLPMLGNKIHYVSWRYPLRHVDVTDRLDAAERQARQPDNR